MISSLVPLEMSVSKVPEQFENAAVKLRASIKDLAPGDAFKILDNELQISVAYTQGSLMYTIYAIALQKAQWDKLDASAQDAIALNFYIYVSDRFGTSQNTSTIDNYLRVAKTWLLDGVEVPEKQLLFEVKEGQTTTVIEGDEAVTISPSIWNVPFSKLLVATTKYNRGEMEEDDWGLLFNPKVSQGQLLTYWSGPKPTDEPSDVLTYAIYNGHLCAVVGNKISDMAEVDIFSINNDTLAEEGWKRLMSVLKVEMMDDSLVTVGTDGLTSHEDGDPEEDF